MESECTKILYAYRMVHICNIPHILRYGFVLPSSEEASSSYVNIGDKSVIEKRLTMNNTYNLKDYIPFYFGTRTPMLYVIQNGYNGVERRKPEEIVYCVVRLCDIEQSDEIDCIFTDGHPISSLTNYYNKNYLRDIDKFVRLEDVNTTYWKDLTSTIPIDTDKKRRKEAELLIKEKLPASYIYAYFVYNDEAKQKLIEFDVDSNIIYVSPKHYF